MNKQHQIHILGDSISRGYGLGVFSDQVPSTHPLFKFRAIWSMINDTFAENNIRDVSVWRNDIIPANGPGAEVAPNLVRNAITNGIIKSGDAVVISDAGNIIPDHNTPLTPAQIDTYKQNWINMIRAICQPHNVTCVMMSMYDYPPAMLTGQFDTNFSGRTLNQVTYEAWLEQQDKVCGQVLYINMNFQMDNLVAAAQSQDNLPVMFSDGIHPNVWGQMLMAGEIMKVLGYRPLINSVNWAKNLVNANLASVQYGSNITASRAGQYVDALLMR